MSNMITEDCFNCGVCERACPSGGITRGSENFVINPDRCTECVGFFHTQQCARACPIDCCVVDPNNPGTEMELFERAKKLTPERAHKLVLGPETSHFRAKDRTLGSTLKRLGRRITGVLEGPNPLP
ncbi:MAG: YfhL family 4Fe-4S dicluster ferredoxin [bacterium]|nr:YfhL family 4Fe-4S dicluster ferredoxin [bacterium]